jgi:phage shock protein E
MRSLFLPAVVLFFWACRTQVSQGVTELSLAQFDTLRKQSNVLVLDVRTWEEYNEGHIPDAENQDWYSDDFQARISKLDTARHIVLYCKSGARSNKAAAVMYQNNFKKVSVFPGGYDAWVEAGKPVESK